MIDDETRGKALGRLRRIEGQIQGIQRMIEEDKYCVDILLQLTGRPGGGGAGAEAPARAPHRVLRDRRHPLGERAGPAEEDGRAPRRLLPLRRPVTPMATETRVDVPVKGMHCAACVGKVERALTGVPGVDKAPVNLATERATVSLDPERAAVAGPAGGGGRRRLRAGSRPLARARRRAAASAVRDRAACA